MSNLSNVRDRMAMTHETYPIEVIDGIVFHVRYGLSREAMRIRREIERPHQAEIRRNQRLGRPLPRELSEHIELETMARYLLADWEGIEDDDGQKIDCTADNIRELLKGDEMSHVRNAISEIATNSDLFVGEQEKEQAEKNS